MLPAYLDGQSSPQSSLGRRLAYPREPLPLNQAFPRTAALGSSTCPLAVAPAASLAILPHCGYRSPHRQDLATETGRLGQLRECGMRAGSSCLCTKMLPGRCKRPGNQGKPGPSGHILAIWRVGETIQSPARIEHGLARPRDCGRAPLIASWPSSAQRRGTWPRVCNRPAHIAVDNLWASGHGLQR